MSELGMKEVTDLDSPEYHDIKGKQHPAVDSLVDLAHRQSEDRGLYLIGTEVIPLQLPTPDNNQTAVFKVRGKFRAKDGDPEDVFTFEAIGDANEDNTGSQVSAHFIRMAETRAMSRMLCLALNIKGVAAEETAASDDDDRPAKKGTSSSSGKSPGGKKIPEWKYKIPFGKNKDKRIDDPTVSTKDLQYFIDNDKLNLKNEDTDEYDIPDEERIALFQAEIDKRKGKKGSSAASGKGKSGGSDEDFKAAKHLKTLLAAGASQDMKYPDIKAFVKENDDFSHVPNGDPAKMDKDDFNALLVMLGGDPID